MRLPEQYIINYNFGGGRYVTSLPLHGAKCVWEEPAGLVTVRTLITLSPAMTAGCF
jgi:hypothetical protein